MGGKAGPQFQDSVPYSNPNPSLLNPSVMHMDGECLIRLKVTMSCTQYETDHDLLGVNDLGIEDTCDWAVPKHSW